MKVTRSLIVTLILLIKMHVSVSVSESIDGRYLRTKRAQEVPRLRLFTRQRNLCLHCPYKHKHVIDSSRLLRHQVALNNLFKTVRLATKPTELDFLKHRVLNKPLYLSKQLYQLFNSLSGNEKNYLGDNGKSKAKIITKARKSPFKRLRIKLRHRKTNDADEASTAPPPTYRKVRSTENSDTTISSSRDLQISTDDTKTLPTATENISFAESTQTDNNRYKTMMDGSTTIPILDKVTLKTVPETTPTITRMAKQRIIKKTSRRPFAKTTVPITVLTQGYIEKIPIEQQQFAYALDTFERNYYNATFGKLLSISPPDRKENGISFVESGLFLYSILIALMLELDPEAKLEMEQVLTTELSIKNKVKTLRYLLDNLPQSSEVLKLHWSTRLLVNGSWTTTTSALDDLHIKLERLNGTDSPEMLTKTLNDKVEEDSGGAMRNTFEEDELAEGARAVLINTVYVRARWRAAPTLLNGTRAFRDAPGAPLRTARMIRINDIMRYANMPEWDAEAVEISYATPGLSLLLLVPRSHSLRRAAEMVSAVGLAPVISRMYSIRIAATLPIYTLRMTLLLPNKLQAMGICRLVDTVNSTNPEELRLSHAVQRLMFWAEAGRNAFKDDGIEWDEPPALEMIVDRPYLFFVRWRNSTIMNGNFVL